MATNFDNFWISVSDRLPECGPTGTGPLLLWDRWLDTPEEEVGCAEIGWFDDNGFHTYCETISDHELDISHWATIPIPGLE